MKLWLLRPVGFAQEPDGGADHYSTEKGGPWDPWYDKTFGWLIRAESEAEARQIAQTNAGPEAYDKSYKPTRPVWLDSEFSTCTELSAEGDVGIVMRDQAMA